MTGSDNLGTFGRFHETSVEQMSPTMRQAHDFSAKLRGHVPGPQKNWLANPKLSQTIVPTGAYVQNESTLTKAEIEIATNVINGAWGAAYSTTTTRSAPRSRRHRRRWNRSSPACPPVSLTLMPRTFRSTRSA